MKRSNILFLLVPVAVVACGNASDETASVEASGALSTTPSVRCFATTISLQSHRGFGSIWLLDDADANAVKLDEYPCYFWNGSCPGFSDSATNAWSLRRLDGDAEQYSGAGIAPTASTSNITLALPAAGAADGGSLVIGASAPLDIGFLACPDTSP